MPSPIWEILKLLADPTRLRVLHLLQQDELSVAEMQEILNMGQSRISSHLSLLKKGDIVKDRKEGKKTYYSVRHNLDSTVLNILKASFAASETADTFHKDLSHLQRIVEKRREKVTQYFNTLAGKLHKNYCPGRSWQAISHFLFHLTPSITIADIGSGEGMIAQMLAKNAKKVYCIDKSPKMIEIGSKLAKDNELTNLTFKLGDLEKIPLKNKSVDLALLSQALHHADHPEKAIDEAFRILKPGGKIIILDLKEHTFKKAHELYADQWLGFSENTLYEWMENSGFTQTSVNIVSEESTAPHFKTLLASGHKRL